MEFDKIFQEGKELCECYVARIGPKTGCLMGNYELKLYEYYILKTKNNLEFKIYIMDIDKPPNGMWSYKFNVAAKIK